MRSVHSYEHVELVQEDESTIVYRARRDDDDSPVLLKVLAHPRRPRDLDRLKNDYEIGRTLDLGSALRPLALESFRGMPTLVLEPFDGEPLTDRSGTPMPIEPFLELAGRIASALADIHGKGIVHRDVEPANILVHPVTGAVKIAGFGIASRFVREQPPTQSPRLIEGSLAYMSPEQTGRMNRAIDSRSDLYSLGVTLYELVTGRLPFRAEDALEWVHSHVARSPLPMTDVDPPVPEAISQIVFKLLAKLPENRYQTARGVLHDLEQCLGQWRRSGHVEPFELGRRDVSERFDVSQRLYGRDAERDVLLHALDRVVTTGAPEVVVVRGHAGIGKSSLASELHKPIAQQHGFFVEAKFDELRRDVPHITIARAFRQVVLEILGESDQELECWRRRFETALGTQGQLIVDLVPEVERIIGAQPPVVPAAPADAEHRFRTVFRRFIAAFASAEHPVALFVDDLQWADSASLQLLADVVSHPDVRHLLLVEAYRDDEVDPSAHPLARALEDVSGAGVPIHTLALGALSEEDVARLVADTTRRPIAEVLPLAQLVYEKAGGNPLFTGQFLGALHESRLLTFDRRNGTWRWDLQKIRATTFGDGVLELVTTKLRRLHRPVLEAVQLAACVGTTFDAHTLALVLDRPEARIHRCLAVPAREGLIVRFGESYRFLHDRVLEAAYGSISEPRRRDSHLQIGRRLLADTSGRRLEERLFDIVAQLEAGAGSIVDPAEKTRLAELHLRAGLRAKAAIAYADAVHHFANGIALLGPACWDEQYPLAFALHVERAHCAWLTGDFEAAERLASEAIRRARTPLESATAYRVLVQLHAFRGLPARALELGLECLDRLGCRLERDPTPADVERAIASVWEALGTRTIEDLTDLPSMSGPGESAVLEMISDIMPAAFLSSQRLHTILLAAATRLCITRGNGRHAPHAYVAFGALLATDQRRVEEGYRFGRVACDLVEKPEFAASKARTLVAFGATVAVLVRPVGESIPYLESAFDVADATGDLAYACYAVTQLLVQLWCRGEPLDSLERRSDALAEYVARASYGDVLVSIRAHQRQIRRLRGLPPASRDLAAAETDYDAWARATPPIAVARFVILCLEEHFVLGELAAAREAVRRAEPLIGYSYSPLEVAEYHFYAALTRAAMATVVGETSTAPAAPGPASDDAIEALDAHLEALARWAQTCPATYEHKRVLVRAERARLLDERAPRGDPLAGILYEDAIRLARESGFVQCEAIANELAAGFYRARGLETIAHAHLREARDGYARWGAEQKVRDLERRFPRLVVHRASIARSTIAAPTGDLDSLSIVKASQAISQEIVLERLVGTLLRIVVQEAGAQRGVLLLARDGALTIDAEVAPTESRISTRVLASLPIQASMVPTSIVESVARTREPVILDDAAADAGAFGADEYVARARPRSLLCMPIVRQAELVGVLYLDHSLVPAIFTEERLAGLQVLASQAAISLSNAMLLVRERDARRAAEDAERRATFLAEATAVLAEPLDVRETLDRLARLAVRSLADLCVIDIVEGDSVERAAGAHVDPAKQPLIAELQRRFPARWDSAHPAARVLRTGEPVLLPEIADAQLRSLCVSDEHERLVRALGARTLLAVPLVARGRTLGVLTLSSGDPRRYGTSDLALARELGGRAAVAIDNARLYRDAQRAVRLRDEFLSVASHELRTPTTSLALALDSLLRADPVADPAKTRKLTELARRQTRKLTYLISDLLDVSRIEAGRLPLRVAEVELGELVREVVARFEIELAHARCPVTISAPAPVVGAWDRSRIDQVVSNLLSNALKFGAGKPIEIEVGKDGSDAVVVVRDHGMGIERARQPHVFERFGRGVSSMHYGGLGLGLYISRRIVDAHGGTIRVDSEPGAGATFRVVLPPECPPGALRDPRVEESARAVDRDARPS